MQEFLMMLLPLLIIMDPWGNMPLFLSLTRHNSTAERRRMAAQACVASAVILAVFALAGEAMLRFFQISMPAFQIAGGLIFLIYALQLLALIPSGIRGSAEEEEEGIRRENIALVPLATPLLAGPGAITAVLVWRQQIADDALIWLFLVIVSACAVVYGVLHFAGGLQRLLGVSGIRVITRLTGLLLAVIAVQFMVNGWQQL